MQIKTLTINGVTYEILGEKGEPGYTPQKGVDYCTEQDYDQLQEKLSTVFVAGQAQELTDDQRAQARQNISAMQNGVADTDLDMQHHKIVNVGGLEFDSGIGLSASVSEYYSNGVILHFASNQGDKKVRLANVADGVADDHAVNVGQMNTAIANAIANIVNGDEVSY